MRIWLTLPNTNTLNFTGRELVLVETEIYGIHVTSSYGNTYMLLYCSCTATVR